MGSMIFNMLIFPGGIFAILFAMLLMGLDRKIYARLQRRVGPPIYQPLLDFVKLIHKEILVPTTANFSVFRIAPLIGFAGMLVAVLIIPIGGVYSGIYKSADLLVLLYLLVTPALALMMGGSASGSPYSAVGMSREMTMALAYEIPQAIVFLTVAMKVGMASKMFADFSLSNIVNYQIAKGPLLLNIAMIPALIAYLCCIPATIGVIPFDIPEAETEITEGPLLEYSGTGLALFSLTGGLKMFVISALGVALFFPQTISSLLIVNLIWFMFKCVVLTIITVTVVRATRARMRADQAFKFFITFPTVMALISLVLVFVSDKF